MNTDLSLEQRIEALELTLQAVSRTLTAPSTICNGFSEGGKSPLPPPAPALRPKEGCTMKILQTLHATWRAGWWQKSDGSKPSFTDVVKARGIVLETYMYPLPN